MKQAKIESGRAEFALNAVKQVVKEYPYDVGKKETELTGKEKKNMKIQKEYKSYARKFPSLILANGFAAAIAFAHEKGNGKDTKEAWKKIYDNIADWLVKNGYPIEPEMLLDYVCALDSDTYRMVTNEVLSLVGWLKRFASGMIEGEADE